MSKPTIDDTIRDLLFPLISDLKRKIPTLTDSDFDYYIEQIKALLTEARIDEAKYINQFASSKTWVDNRIKQLEAQLKNEATDPVKRVRELRDEWE